MMSERRSTVKPSQTYQILLLHPSRYATSKLAVQNVSACQYVAAMNPTAGSFQVSSSALSMIAFALDNTATLFGISHCRGSCPLQQLSFFAMASDQSPTPTTLLGLLHWNAKPDITAGHLRDLFGRTSSARKARQTLPSWCRTSLR